MRTLATLALCALALLAETHEVQKLADEDVKSLAAARAEVARAEAALEKVETAIRRKHGEPEPKSYIETPCLHSYVRVELRGDFALITKGVEGVCTVLNARKAADERSPWREF